MTQFESNTTTFSPVEEKFTADREPNPEWYERTGFHFFGNLRVHAIASIVYLGVALVPFIQFIWNSYKVPVWVVEFPAMLFIWALFAALAYPTWAWLEAASFEKWVRHKPEAQRKIERANFALQSGLAKNFWTAVVATYSVASLLGIALKR